MRLIAIILLAPFCVIVFPFIVIGHMFGQAVDWWMGLAERFVERLERK